MILALLQTMALYKWPALRLAFLPGVTEAFFDAGIAHAVFGMPFTMALSLGFILKAVGPGLVVPAMFQLQKQGWGANKGIPSTVVIAASFDDIIAITGFSIFINVAIASGDDAAWMIASGPLQVGSTPPILSCNAGAAHYQPSVSHAKLILLPA